MYDLSRYCELDERTIITFIERHPFAFLTGCDANNSPVVTQVPVFSRTTINTHPPSSATSRTRSIRK
jgi:predicted FMN-binding regulatory protein PaiB